MASLDEEMRTRIRRFLPKALELVISSHKANAPNHPYNPDTKKQEPLEVKRGHDACKSAVSHMQLLLAFAQDMDKQSGENEAENEKKELAEMIINAQCEIDKAGEI